MTSLVDSATRPSWWIGWDLGSLQLDLVSFALKFGVVGQRHEQHLTAAVLHLERERLPGDRVERNGCLNDIGQVRRPLSCVCGGVGAQRSTVRSAATSRCSRTPALMAA